MDSVSGRRIVWISSGCASGSSAQLWSDPGRQPARTQRHSSQSWLVVSSSKTPSECLTLHWSSDCINVSVDFKTLWAINRLEKLKILNPPHLPQDTQCVWNPSRLKECKHRDVSHTRSAGLTSPATFSTEVKLEIFCDLISYVIKKVISLQLAWNNDTV